MKRSLSVISELSLEEENEINEIRYLKNHCCDKDVSTFCYISYLYFVIGYRKSLDYLFGIERDTE